MSEYRHVEKPFLDQLAALGWATIEQGHGSIQYTNSKRHFYQCIKKCSKKCLTLIRLISIIIPVPARPRSFRGYAKMWRVFLFKEILYKV